MATMVKPRDHRKACRPGAIVLLTLAAFTGCADSAARDASVVSGKVTLAGSPITSGAVLFMTDAGNAASAELKADGTYVVHCEPGRFKVAVTPPAPPDPLATAATATPAASASTSPIPKRYHDFGTSGLVLDVKKGNNTFDIALTR